MLGVAGLLRKMFDLAISVMGHPIETLMCLASFPASRYICL